MAGLPLLKQMARTGHALTFVGKARELLSSRPLAAMGADRYMLITAAMPVTICIHLESAGHCCRSGHPASQSRIPLSTKCE